MKGRATFHTQVGSKPATVTFNGDYIDVIAKRHIVRFDNQRDTLTGRRRCYPNQTTAHRLARAAMLEITERLEYFARCELAKVTLDPWER